MIKLNDTVRVYPHGEPDRGANARVVQISSNGLSIALAFGETSPPFAVVKGGGAAIHPEHGLMMLARREEGKPWGPWIEMFGGGAFEIEK